LASPMLFHAAFPLAPEGDGNDENDESDDDALVESQEDFLGELGKLACKGAVLLAEAIKKLFDGTYDEGVEALCAHGSPETALADIDCETLRQPMGADFKELLRSLHAAESVVRASGSSLPQISLRELVRQSSEAEDPKAAEAERADVWKRAQAQRKKLVTLALAKDSKASSLHEVLKRKGGDVAKFVGVVGESRPQRLIRNSCCIC